MTDVYIQGDREIHKIFSDRFVSEFRVTTVAAAGAVDTHVGGEGRRLCLQTHAPSGVVSVKDLDTDECLAAFSLMNFVSIAPTKFVAEPVAEVEANWSDYFGESEPEPLVKEADPELERLLAEEEEIERQAQATVQSTEDPVVAAEREIRRFANRLDDPLDIIFMEDGAGRALMHNLAAARLTRRLAQIIRNDG